LSNVGATSLMLNLRHNGVLHENVVLLTIEALEEPVVADGRRLEVAALGGGLWRAVLRYGFMERPDVGRDVEPLAGHGIPLDPARTSFFIARATAVRGEPPLLPGWQRRLFVALGRLATGQADFLNLPPAETLELGNRIGV
jgi:KUP system potassium uptake protein